MAGNFQAIILLFTAALISKDVRAQMKNFTLGGERFQAEKLNETDDYKQCYVDVIVHNSSSFKFGLKDALVTAISGVLMEVPKYSQANSNAEGKVCLPVLCGLVIRLFVEKNDIRIPALNKTTQQRNIPEGYLVQIETGNEVIQSEAYAWGNLQGQNGPVYNVFEKDECKTASLDNYHFVFSYITVPDQLFATPFPMTGLIPNHPGFRYMWRYGLTGSGAEPKTCYFKVKFKVQSEVNVTASSYEDSATGKLLGTFTTGPQFNPESYVSTDKAACVEYRCPIMDIKTRQVYNTYIEGSISVPGMKAGCCARLRKDNQLFNANATSFWTENVIQQSKDYGPNYGIYMSETPQIARSRCFTGHDYISSEYAMDVNKGYAFEYDCTSSICDMPGIVG